MSGEAAILPVPRLLTADEVAEILGVSRAHVYAVRHKIGAVQFGRMVRFRMDDVERYIASHTQSTPDAIGKIDVRAL